MKTREIKLKNIINGNYYLQNIFRFILNPFGLLFIVAYVLFNSLFIFLVLILLY